MVYVLMGIAYILSLAFFLRFFQGVRRWDEEIRSMATREPEHAQRAPKPKAA